MSIAHVDTFASAWLAGSLITEALPMLKSQPTGESSYDTHQ